MFDCCLLLKGNTVEKTATINSESQQRAKILSADLQRALRQEKEIAATAEKNRKLENELISRNEIYAKNDKCEEQLFHVTPEVETNNFEDLPIEAFHKVKPMDLLDAFIRVRFFKQSTAPKGQAKRIPRKKRNGRGSKKWKG